MSKEVPPHQSSSLEKNKQIIRNFIEGTLTRHDIAAADRYFEKPVAHFFLTLLSYEGSPFLML
jgi:hypothetical protein